MLTRPSFFEARNFEFSEGLVGSWAALREEAQAVLERFLYLQFINPELYVTQNGGVIGRRGMFYFVMAGMSVQGNRARCPRISQALEGIPDLFNAAIYMLGPHAHILPHTGFCDRVLRAHLGLICPPDCALRIGSEARAWREGELMVFDDTLEHEAWNRSQEWRAVLSFDFFYPVAGDPATRQALALQALGQKPAEHVWYEAAGLEVPAGITLPGHEAVRAMVSSHGLYFA